MRALQVCNFLGDYCEALQESPQLWEIPALESKSREIQDTIDQFLQSLHGEAFSDFRAHLSSAGKSFCEAVHDLARPLTAEQESDPEVRLMLVNASLLMAQVYFLLSSVSLGQALGLISLEDPK
ncbi:MAG: hypothetical protein ACRD5I_10715 [Candidatus Acidiferrales bacterium]